MRSRPSLPAATARRTTWLGALAQPLPPSPASPRRPRRRPECGARQHLHAGYAMHVHAPNHPLTRTNATVTGRMLRLHCASTSADTCDPACRTPQAMRPRREAAARRLPRAAEAVRRLPWRPVGGRRGLQAADGPAASASTGSVCAVRPSPATAHEAAAQQRRLRCPRAPSQGCSRARAGNPGTQGRRRV